MNDSFTDEQIRSLTPKAQFILMRLGSHLEPSFITSYFWSALELLNVLYKMDKPLTVNGIMKSRPKRKWDSIQNHSVLYYDDSPRLDNEGRTTLTEYFIPLFVDTGLLIKNRKARYITYVTTSELKELIRLWLGNEICG